VKCFHSGEPQERENYVSFVTGSFFVTPLSIVTFLLQFKQDPKVIAIIDTAYTSLTLIPCAFPEMTTEIVSELHLSSKYLRKKSHDFIYATNSIQYQTVIGLINK
jgi:hypothetical protein